MMNDSFFRNYSHHQPSRSVRYAPSQQRSSPKVVSVPVHFISSDQPRMTLSMLKDSAALNIQRVFRGFLVRKSVKKIASIRNAVGEIERRIGDIEVVDLIREDAKERLKVNETLMSLLFKLDSIRGVDTGVRDLRKAVTRKAIALQEKVDSIALQEKEKSTVSTSFSEQVTETSGDLEGGAVKEVTGNCKPADGRGVEAEELSEIRKEDGHHTSVEVQKVKEEEDDKGKREEVLAKLMADKEQMMKVTMQVLERNEMQTRMINSLSRRVEQLEKAFMSERKKKTHVALKRRRRRVRDIDDFCTFFP